MRGFLGVVCVAIAAAACGTATAQAPEDRLAQAVSALMLPANANDSFRDWDSLDSLTLIRWRPLPPKMLNDALQDGSYFTRAGTADLAGRRLNVTATGARTMVVNVYFRTAGAPVGEAAMLAALTRAGLTTELARCPIKPSPAAGSKWWQVKGAGKQGAWLRLRTSCDGAKCEELALQLPAKLPSMTPQESRLYTDRCAAGAAASQSRPAAAWDEQLASLLAALIPPQGASAVEWKALDKVAAVRWQPLPPRESKQPPFDDGNRHYRPGELDLGGRVLHVNATGTRTNVLNVYLQDQTTHGDRGDALRTLWSKGYAVQLARCGKVYQLSSQTWYRVTKAGFLPVAVRRGIRCDTNACPKAEEDYRLALTGTLPPLQTGEVEAAGNRCPGR
jgi:hypothetical protein